MTSPNAGVPRSKSPLGLNATDSRGYQSPPDSRSNSLESSKANNFGQPLTPPLPPLHTNQPTPRKPLPPIPASVQGKMGSDESTPQSEISTGSFNQALDMAVLDKVHPPQRGISPPPGSKLIFRQGTQMSATSSQYGDASTESPSYASTVYSEEPAKSQDRPRAGVLRTVGDEAHDTAALASGDIPEINFGPTFNLAAPLGTQRTPTSNTPPQRPYSPAQKTPTFDMGHFRQGSDDTVRRSVAWQPANSSPNASNPVSRPMSPEQYVQQRAQHAATPLYSHQRQPSGNTLASLRMTTPTPPLNRPTSYEPGMQHGHSRSISSDILRRPSSQGAQSALGMVTRGEVSSHLSAREQEEVARLTGTSLIQGAGNYQAPPGAGLVGAIAQREKEKQQMRQGYGNQAVQNAINQRQIHTPQMYQQQIPQQPQVYQQQMPQQPQVYQQQMPQQSQVYGMSNLSSPPAYTSIPQPAQPRQQYGAAPAQYAPQMFAHSGGWPNPNVRQQDQLGPNFMSPLQGQQSPAVHQGQGGRGYSPGPHFQGQAY